MFQAKDILVNNVSSIVGVFSSTKLPISHGCNNILERKKPRVCVYAFVSMPKIIDKQIRIEEKTL